MSYNVRGVAKGEVGEEGLGTRLALQWNLLLRTPLGPAVLSFAERLSSFRGDFLSSVYT